MYTTVIFDLDGTLLDTLPDLTDSVNFAMTMLGLRNYSRAEVGRMVGNGMTIEAVAKMMNKSEDEINDLL